MQPETEGGRGVRDEGARGKEVFVWPPKEPESAEDSANSSASNQAKKQERAQTENQRVVLRGRDGGGDEPWFVQVERAWLGYSCEPWKVRVGRSGWEADRSSCVGGWVYCPGCGQSVGEHEVMHDEKRGRLACSGCSGVKLPWDRVVRLGEYEGVLGGAIRDLKFSGMRQLGFELGGLLGLRIGQAMADAGVGGRSVGVVPMPISLRRRLSRGIDHGLALARGVRRETGLELVGALEREHRPSQTHVPRGKRRANVAGSISVRQQHGLRPESIILMIDDVMTTGSTMRAACGALRASGLGVEIWACVCGVANDRGRCGGGGGG